MKRAVLLCLLLTLTACGSVKIKGEPPLVALDELFVEGTAVRLQLSVRNVNDVPLPVERVRMTLRDGDLLLAEHDSAPSIDLVANGTELFDVQFEAQPVLRDRLQAVASGQQPSLGYRLEGSVWTTSGDRLEYRHRGHLFPVPGREGHFRATGHAEPDRRRERHSLRGVSPP